MNGGYLMVSKTDTNLYTKLNNALTLGKPVLWYEDDNTCYYIDTITKSGTDIVLTKGDKTITIENNGDVTESGDIQTHLYSNNIRLLGTDSYEHDIYIFFTIIANKILEKSEILDYIKQFTNVYLLPCNGYDNNTDKVIVSLYYENNNYKYLNNTDDNYTFTVENSDIYNTTTQIF